MSTPTSRDLFLALCLGLAGCAEGVTVSRAAPERIALPDGLIVAGARGWCVDRQSSRSGRGTSVVVLASCAAISRNALAARPDVPGVVTVSVESAPGSASSPAALEAFFGTATGRAALARDGDAGSIDILETRREGDLLFLHARDRSIPQGASSDTWRAIFDLDGRFVAVSLYGLRGRPIPPPAAFHTLAAHVDRLKDANGR